MAKGYAALAQIIGRHLNRHAIAGNRLDAELAHFAAHIGQYVVLVIQRDAIIPVRQHLGDDAVEFEQFLFRHDLDLSAPGLRLH